MAMEQEYLFLKLGDIKGKATTEGFKDQIVLQNMSYGVSQGGSWEEGTQLSGRITTFSDLSCVKLMDVASPSLATACATKEQFPKAEISVTAGTKDAYYKLPLEKVIITSISTSIARARAISPNPLPSASAKGRGSTAPPRAATIWKRTRRCKSTGLRRPERARHAPGRHHHLRPSAHWIEAAGTVVWKDYTHKPPMR